MSIYDRPVKELLHDWAEETLRKGQVFSKNDAVEWFMDRYPKVKSNTVELHIDAMSTNNGRNRRHHKNVKEGSGHDLFYKTGRGEYRLYDPEGDPAPVYDLDDEEETAKTKLASWLKKAMNALEAEHIHAAMDECSQLGLDVFLDQGGFGRPAKDWVKRDKEETKYPAKAIVAAALGKLEDGRQFRVNEFFDGFGEKEGREKLSELGFEVIDKTKLKPEPEADAVTDATNAPLPSAVNLILYGPPGTGKTYQTAWEAVRLCLGEQVASGLKGSEQRAALMSAYRDLVSEGRIEFVTFHQSMSYEEFIEGLRPTTDTAEGGSTDTGFRLEPVAGIFRRIAERASLSLNADEQLPEDTSGFDIGQNAGGSDDTSAIFEANDHDEEPFDLEGLNIRELPQGPLYTSGDMPETIDRKKSNRRLAQAVIRNLSEKFPDGFGVNQLGEALEEASILNDVRPRDGWRAWPAWLKREAWIREIAGPGMVNMRQEEATVDIHEESGYVLIIDEINRANISKVFGELITLLEPDKRLGMDNEIRLTLPYSKKSFGVPRNLHVIGTMNTADRSIALLDTALRRRFAFRELMPDPSVLSNNINGVDLQKLLSTINERIEYLFDREHQIGHAYFTNCQTRTDIENVMRDKVIPLLAEYFYEDWSKVAAVLGDSGQGPSRFLDAKRITAPAGMTEDDFSSEKLQWTVKDRFDFSEFSA
ncbi:McrB family protein [Antarcticimicrobium sediminis]|uniref:McrB family protein n=1 Tax=Antarcticimicrobium sediminis TaxID=2546227 RepID=UPI001FE092A5|nr:AAA family ATPase [Antarcticimicrobium sediminis]